jgi:enoyl-CoA hydratase/carnithine racemase
MYKNLITDRKVRIGIIKINRPYIKNAINKETMLEIRKAVREFRNNDKIKVILITGVKGSFSAGMDLKSVHGLEKSEVEWISALGRLVLLEIKTGIEFDMDPVDYFKGVLLDNKIQWKIGENWKPLVAAIDGYALGGGLELALACDFRFASENSILGYPEVDLRIFPAWGGTQYTPLIIGPAKAKHLIISCDKISAQEAKDLGLIHDVFKTDLMEKSLEFAKGLSRKDQKILRMVKSMVEQSTGEKLIKGLAMEHEYSTNW